MVDACNKGMVENARKAHAAGVDVNMRARNGWPLIILATVYQQDEIVQFLIEKGANVNAKAINGETALDRAVDLKSLQSINNKNTKSERIYDMLIKAGAKNSSKTNELQKAPRKDFEGGANGK